MRFIVQNHSWTPPDVGPRAAILGLDNWDDFGFRTSFDLWFRPAENTSPVGIGRVKIALADQPTGPSPVPEGEFPDGLPTTGSPWISVGQDALYYETLAGFGQAGQEILRGLGDVTTTEDASRLERELRNLEQSSAVFRISLLRNISLNTVLRQWRRIATGGPRQTQYWFSYHLPQAAGEIVHPPLDFEVRPSSVPSSNIHVLIGPNGVGKTTLLRSLATAAVAPTPVPMPAEGRIVYNNDVGFANVLLVTFSAFDPFIGVHPGREVKFQHVGLTAYRDSGEPRDAHGSRLKEREELADEFIDSLRSIATSGRYDQWVTTLFILGSDRQFRDAVIGNDEEETPITNRPIGLLLKGNDNELTNGAGRSWRAIFTDLSSGHALVLLTVTRLVDLVAERTLVLIDEPEAHLHPPLLSSFVRALSELLSDRNGVAIAATHSPVVLQEVPKSCDPGRFRVFIRQVRCRATRCRLAWNTALGLVSSHVEVSCIPAQSAPIGHFGSLGQCPGSGPE
ncbi:AAA family ATPase [Streptomyces rubiginosohelvolus]